MFKLKQSNRHQPEAIWLGLIALCVFSTGFLAILSVLFAQARKETLIVAPDAHITILAGLSLVYLASRLRRGKKIAWAISLPLFLYILIRNARHFLIDLPPDNDQLLPLLLNLIVPLLAVLGLTLGRKYFIVKGGLDSFAAAAKRATLVLVIAFLYGVVGYQLMDHRDFHKEIDLMTSAKNTLSQFGLFTANQPHPYSKRAKLFEDSLSVISVGSIFYVGVSLFGPLRFKLSEQQHNRETMTRLLESSGANSEDFFKLWPQDKAYFFTPDFSAGLAYKVQSGVALCVGDPAGNPSGFNELIKSFVAYCHANDWEPAFIHSEARYSALYERLGFEKQKIGEEAVVDIENFSANVAGNKYFRHIKNKFAKAGYSCEVIEPPHHPDIIKVVRKISDEWLDNPGRTERGFMMGYFNEDYMNRCRLIIARDGAGNIQAFINQIPSYDKNEANFDFLRSTREGLGNINDYLMVSFIAELNSQGIKRLNMGLSPLSGLDIKDGGFINDALNFVYTNSGRLYSFSGLKRFKEKYEPGWQDRYIVYRGGVRGFGRTINALVRALRV